MINSYNRIAPYYSFLSKIIYGNQLIKVQTLHFQELKKDGSVLIFGGGDGKILPHLFAHCPHLEVHYLDASDKMIALAQKINPFEKIYFEHTEELPENGNFDIIILPFILDIFTKEQIHNLCSKLKDILHPDALILVSDFGKTQNIWQSFLLKSTILFFRLFTSHPLPYLEDIQATLAQSNLTHLKTSTLSKGFLFSSMWKLGK
ncbi:MAG: class I SAM-dependent methyltransferase [Bacteroidia bacterium]